VPAALAAEAAAQQGSFDEMYQQLFLTHTEWAGTDEAAATFRTMAEDLGLDMAAYDAAIEDPATLDRIEVDYTAGVGLGVESTPTIFIDGERLDLQSVDDIEAGIQAALED
jgi:protein-disulfide isomerase